ncbi:MAG TPA: LysR family transcriptional regulator [Gemmatimonadaceae bacterium]|nr:LysR family transcriptional regulator [Gemmatimonadaceae bacterium]
MRSDPELRHLRAFVAVVDHGGYTRAARALGVSQSTVSEAVLALERALGTPLFVKGRRSAQRTAAGEALLPHARHMLGAMDAALAEVAEAAAEAAVTVRVGTSESVSTYLLQPVIAEARRAHPPIRYQVTTADCADVRAGLASGRFDVALLLVEGSGSWSDEEMPLGVGRLVAFAQPAHPCVGRGAEAADVWEVDVHLSDASGTFYEMTRRFLQDAGLPPNRLHSAGSVEGVKRAISSDPAAVGLLPAYAIAEELRRGVVAEVRLAPPLAPIALVGLLPRRGTIPAPARALLAALRGVRLDPTGPSRIIALA